MVLSSVRQHDATTRIQPAERQRPLPGVRLSPALPASLPTATASQGGTATLLPCAPAWRHRQGQAPNDPATAAIRYFGNSYPMRLQYRTSVAPPDAPNRCAAGVRTSSVSLLRRSTDPSGWELPRICHAHDPQRNRLFSRREAQGAPSEVLEVGDLSCRENEPDRALVGLFSDHDDGQQGRQGSPQAAVG